MADLSSLINDIWQAIGGGQGASASPLPAAGRHPHARQQHDRPVHGAVVWACYRRPEATQRKPQANPLGSFRRNGLPPKPTVQYSPSLRKSAFWTAVGPRGVSPPPAAADRALGV